MIALFLSCLIAPALPQSPPAAQAAFADPVEVQDSNGLFRARLGKVEGQERVPDAIARFKVSVFDVSGGEVWSAFHPPPKEGLRYLLADDGSTFVDLDPAWSDARAVLQLWRGGDAPSKVFGGQLGIDREALKAARPAGAWLAGDDEPRFDWIPAGDVPHQVLRLVCVDGQTRTLELLSGLLLDSGGGDARVWVEPGYEKDSVPPSKVPPVTLFTAPERAPGDEPLAVAISGAFPNPGWRIFAFSLELEAAAKRVTLTPHARPPMPGGLVLQQTEPYRVEARLHGLPPGRYELNVQGQSGLAGAWQPIEITPGGVLAVLRRSGGLLGLDETLTLYENGVVQRVCNKPAVDALFFADPRRFADARERLSRLPGLSPPPSKATDLVHQRLTWRNAGRWLEATADDLSAGGELTGALDAVRALVP